MLQKPLGTPNRAGKSYPKARSMASSGHSSLPHLPTQSVVETVTGEVGQAFVDAPRSALVALVEDPMGHFEFEDLLCAHQYVMEHSLYLWIGNQNHDRGVAPSREQILARALSFIPAQAPE